MSAIDPPKFVDTIAAAAYLGVRAQTLENWRCTKRNIIPFTRIGSKIIRYKLADLDAWLESRIEGAALEPANA
ncbi:MAG TPA: helix-turn-helix domain-containing protein [Tepidisphaeraceae bacterium]|jgi:excisionase family DNA binding protein|nr:helix-turn-helix domain-containing protein [Tepidisphaeraceae bacterium]